MPLLITSRTLAILFACIMIPQAHSQPAGTGRALPTVDRQVHPSDFDGIWDLSFSANRHVQNLSIFARDEDSILRRIDPNKPSRAVAVIQFANEGDYRREAFALPYEVLADGQVRMAYGQFGFCNCRQMAMRVRPTSDPDVLEGEWTLHKDEGTVVFTRRARNARVRSIRLEQAHREAGEWQSLEYPFGERLGHIRRNRQDLIGHRNCSADKPRHCASMTLSILGDHFAGPHSARFADNDDLVVTEAQWICEAGSVQQDKWAHCGLGPVPGSTTIGIRLTVSILPDATTGVQLLSVDSTPIPMLLSIVQSSETLAERQGRQHTRAGAAQGQQL